MGILASLKLSIGLALAILLLAGGWRLERGKLLTQRDALGQENSRLIEALEGHIKLSVGLTARLDSQNKQIESLLKSGEALRTKLFAEAEMHFRERAALRKKLAEMPPLPQDCEAAARETARSLKQMVGRE